MTESVLLFGSLIVLGLITVGMVVWIVRHPRPRTVVDEVLIMTDQQHEFLRAKTSGCPTELHGNYQEIFDQFDLAMTDSDFGYGDKITRQEIVMAQIAAAADSTNFIASDDDYDLNTITRAELMALRAKIDFS